jgi:hypothetical protein
MAKRVRLFDILAQAVLSSCRASLLVYCIWGVMPGIQFDVSFPRHGGRGRPRYFDTSYQLRSTTLGDYRLLAVGVSPKVCENVRLEPSKQLK